ncbi:MULTISPECIES: hypothetical protein [unclassified Mesorhizobium]|uniref:hypothetical protein n=1 Tax=unclassified Mesorhizobium TaxID=325217 RepID=UPI0012EA5994|nr:MULTISPECIES: hypothetical protein [unclassified Mesorhizobium]
MEFAVCYDHSVIDLAWSIFLSITTVFMFLAPLAVARLIAILRGAPVARLQTA